MFSRAPRWKLYRFRLHRRLQSVTKRKLWCGVLLVASMPTGFVCSVARPEQTNPAAPVVVQPGGPGKSTNALPPSTLGARPPLSRADVEFMQGMIMDLSQAVDMTALIPSHTQNKELG